MFNFIKKYCFIFVLFFCSFLANAGLIEGVNYIKVNHGTEANPNYIDWAWASFVSVEKYYDVIYDLDGNIKVDGNGEDVIELVNTLKAPDTIFGWDNASEGELNYFIANVSIDRFINGASFISAISFWNSNKDEVINSTDFEDGSVTGTWVEDSEYRAEVNLLLNNDTSYYDTFYVRRHVQTSVPEPSTLLIFALGLIALASKKRVAFRTNK